MLSILQEILHRAWSDGKTFGITVICGVTGRVMHFPMKGTMLVSCDRVGSQGIATKKGVTLYLTEAESSAEIGNEWLTKPVDEFGTQPHRELGYLGDPAELTGYEGGYRQVYNSTILVRGEGDAICSANVRKIVIIACSGDDGDIDAHYAERGFVGFEKAYENPGEPINFFIPLA
jgi:hypothetical protein